MGEGFRISASGKQSKFSNGLVTYCSAVWKATHSCCIRQQGVGVRFLGYSVMEMGEEYGRGFPNSITFCLGRGGALKIWWTGVEGFYTWTIYCEKDVGYSGMLIHLWSLPDDYHCCFKSQLPDPRGKPLCITLFADKTQLSSFGNEKGYPIMAQLCQLPQEVRNMKGLGGTQVVGWLPIVSVWFD